MKTKLLVLELIRLIQELLLQKINELTVHSIFLMHSQVVPNIEREVSEMKLLKM